MPKHFSLQVHEGKPNPKPPHMKNHLVGRCDSCGRTDELIRVDGWRLCAPCLEKGVPAGRTLPQGG